MTCPDDSWALKVLADRLVVIQAGTIAGLKPSSSRL
jgi:hypothetical protein